MVINSLTQNMNLAGGPVVPVDHMEAGVLGSGVLVANVLHLATLLVAALAINVHPYPPPQPGDVFIPEEGNTNKFFWKIRIVTFRCAPRSARQTRLSGRRRRCSLCSKGRCSERNWQEGPRKSLWK